MLVRAARAVGILCVATATSTAIFAQQPEALIRTGDAAVKANHLADALQAYGAAIAADPSNYESLWKGGDAAVTLGEFDPDVQQRDSLFALGERYGRRAVSINPRDAAGHFTLARALGRKALSLGVRDRAHYANDIRAEALAALALNPNHAGALHVMGMWNDNIMRLSAIQRLAAKALLGASSFAQASWKEAQLDMEHAVALEPGRIVHRLDLGRVYADRHDVAKAREQFQLAVSMPLLEYNDAHYRHEADSALKTLR
jgi:tetratricopeptide (TPR) repeat protein